MKTIGYTALILATTAAVGAFAHSGATGVMKERMDAMMAMGKSVKSVAPMMRGETGYDAEAVRAAGETFAEHGGEAMVALFPEGTGGTPSVAKPAVWSEPEAFAALAARLESYGRGLVTAADNGVAQGGDEMSAGEMMGAGSMMGTDAGSMMGTAPAPAMGGAMMAQLPDPEDLEFATMPANAAFDLVAQTCSACHARYRAEAK